MCDALEPSAQLGRKVDGNGSGKRHSTEFHVLTFRASLLCRKFRFVVLGQVDCEKRVAERVAGGLRGNTGNAHGRTSPVPGRPRAAGGRRRAEGCGNT